MKKTGVKYKKLSPHARVPTRANQVLHVSMSILQTAFL